MSLLGINELLRFLILTTSQGHFVRDYATNVANLSIGVFPPRTQTSHWVRTLMSTEASFPCGTANILLTEPLLKRYGWNQTLEWFFVPNLFMLGWVSHSTRTSSSTPPSDLYPRRSGL